MGSTGLAPTARARPGCPRHEGTGADLLDGPVGQRQGHAAQAAARRAAAASPRAHRATLHHAPGARRSSCYLAAEAFDHRAARGGFALHWRSHGLAYGIGIEIEEWLALGDRVVVNGSREYLAQAHARYPGLIAVNITVRTELLAQRLRARGREDEQDIQARLARAQAPFPLPARCRYVDIANDAAPAVAAQALARVIIGA